MKRPVLSALATLSIAVASMMSAQAADIAVQSQLRFPCTQVGSFSKADLVCHNPTSNTILVRIEFRTPNEFDGADVYFTKFTEAFIAPNDSVHLGLTFSPWKEGVYGGSIVVHMPTATQEIEYLAIANTWSQAGTPNCTAGLSDSQQGIETSVDERTHDTRYIAYPNPAVDKAVWRALPNETFEVYSSVGEHIGTVKANAAGDVEWQTASVAGVYYMHGTNHTLTVTVR